MNVPLEPGCGRTATVDQVAEFRAIRDRGVEALRAGDLRRALELFTAAAACARTTGDLALTDLADCNRAAIQIELGDGAGVLAQMRSVLLRSRDAQGCMVAATNAAVMPGSNAECPASSTITSRASGQAWCSVHAVRGGQTTS